MSECAALGWVLLVAVHGRDNTRTWLFLIWITDFVLVCSPKQGHEHFILVSQVTIHTWHVSFDGNEMYFLSLTPANDNEDFMMQLPTSCYHNEVADLAVQEHSCDIDLTLFFQSCCNGVNLEWWVQNCWLNPIYLPLGGMTHGGLTLHPYTFLSLSLK